MQDRTATLMVLSALREIVNELTAIRAELGQLRQSRDGINGAVRTPATSSPTYPHAVARQRPSDVQ